MRIRGLGTAKRVAGWARSLFHGGPAILVNQRVAASGGPILKDTLGDAGGISDVPFQMLSSAIEVDGSGLLTVVLSNDTGTAVNRVSADAIAIRKVRDLGGADVPEPATATLAMLGLGGLMMRRRRCA